MMSTAWARVFQVYGPGEQPGKLVSTAIRQFQRGKSPSLVDPHAVLDWIHVDDVAAALAELCLSGRSGVFNIATGVGTSSSTVVYVVGSLLHLPPRTASQMSTLNECNLSLVACDDESLIRRLDRPLMGIAQGIEDVLNAANPGL